MISLEPRLPDRWPLAQRALLCSLQRNEHLDRARSLLQCYLSISARTHFTGGPRELYKVSSDAASDKKRQLLQVETCRAFTPVREGVSVFPH
jgi:hypothetical protein